MGKTDERKKFMEKNIDRKMTDAELSRKFGRYQIIESIGMLGGALCVIIASILAFVQHDLMIFAILFFGGVVPILLAALPAQKKKKKLMHQQPGSYFRAELTREPSAQNRIFLRFPSTDRFLKPPVCFVFHGQNAVWKIFTRESTTDSTFLLQTWI